MATLPRCAASIRTGLQASILPRTFFQIRSHPRPAWLWLTLPLAGCVEDFHLQVTRVVTTAKLVAFRATRHVSRTHKKRRLMRRLVMRD
jgi:hypothetical protein